MPVSYTHLRAHETPEHLVCRLLLEKNDIISRKIYAEIPPRVEYSLTKKGKTLVPVFDMLNDWALDYIK